MKRNLENRSVKLLCRLAVAASIALPFPALAASVILATQPMATSTASNVKPNIMFILDDSGSMGWDYLPDWANDNDPTTGVDYSTTPGLFKNNGFNGVAYNPAITYKPPVLFNADGTLNTTTYPNIGAPWTAVKYDAYGVLSNNTALGRTQYCPDGSIPAGVMPNGTCNLVGNAEYYVFVPGEYCSSTKMTSCVPATAPTTVAGVTYDIPAGLRWCDSAALSNCRSINNSTYRYPRYPGEVMPATATIRVTGGGTATSITVNGFQILSAPTVSSGTTSTVANRIVTNINNCTAAIAGACTIAGYSATRSGSTVTITAPAALGAITYLPSASGTMSKIVTAFSGGITVPGSNAYTDIVSTTPAYAYPGTASKASSRTDCVGATCTYTEEMTNYANWWTYYHTRMQAMKTSVSRAFKAIDSRYRVGFSTISYTGATDGTTFLGNNTFEGAHKNSWFTKLLASNATSSTPLRGALSKAGRYYANKISGQNDPVQYSCQQNFSILSTDGYWNDSTSDSYGPKALDGATNVGNLDGGSTPRPMYEGPTTASNSLADVAKYYYDTDLRTATNCDGATSPDFPGGNTDVCTNNVYTSTSDNNVNQHMTSFTMGLGADGTLNYSTDYETATSGDYYDLFHGLGSPTVNWPDPINNSTGERIDDLWHAAVNGHGLYFSAKNPDQIVAGFTKALSSITAKLGAAAAAATSTLNPVAGNNFAYVASYTTVKWTGNLESRTINTTSGAVSETATWCVENIAAPSCTSPGVVVPDSSGSSTTYNCVVSGATAGSCTAPAVFDAGNSTCSTQIANSCPGTMPAKVGTSSDSRSIYTANDAGTGVIPFDAAYATSHPANFSAAHISGLNQWGTLSALQQGAAVGVNLLNYLRGQTGYEDRSSNTPTSRIYRVREATLGDALESQPAFIASPTFNYTYPGYQAFKATWTGRAGTVYMGTNDGMLHAFAASNGDERWAYVPSLVIPNLWRLASNNYDTNHYNFVNGSPIISDIFCTSCGGGEWRTILVAGLNGGGRGYYALDITDPSAPPTLLWEFNANKASPYGDADLGYTFGRPVIARKSDGTWVVLVTSGYDNGTLSSDPAIANSPAGSGVGYLYVLNASTGAIINKISTTVGSTATPSGLAQISVWNNAPSGNEAGYVYGGDLLGNVWRFNIDTAAPPMLLATLSAGGFAQPITTTPVLGLVNTNHVVFVGTGKYLEVTDLTNIRTQSLYAIKDDGTSIGNPRLLVSSPGKMVPQTFTVAGATRTGTSNAVDFETDRGWYIDFPDVSTGSERQNIDSKLVSGVLIVPTLVPSSTVCSPGGYGWLSYFDYTDGSGSSVKFDATIVGVNVIYLPKPVVEVVTSVDPTPTIPPGNPPFSSSSANFRGQRTIWRELIQ
ncbi:MAG: hypothetical protein HZB47_07650 [Nitrosomonadales bacterium]|nr:hypothetical protein [Nitrosomonadales bacterium]